MFKKTTTISGVLVNERHFRPRARYTVLDPSLWTSGVLNDVLVSGLPGLVGLSVHSQSLSFQYTHVLWSAALAPMVGASCFPNVFQISVQFFPFEIYLRKFPHCPLWTVFLNWYKFLVSALSSLLNDILHYQYIVTALKIIIYNHIVCFYLQTSKMHLKLSVI